MLKFHIQAHWYKNSVESVCLETDKVKITELIVLTFCVVMGNTVFQTKTQGRSHLDFYSVSIRTFYVTTQVVTC